jgi:leucyl aminopeptidase (aminopeptidase T)
LPPDSKKPSNPPSSQPKTPPRSRADLRRSSVSLRLSSIDFEVVNAARRIIEGSLGVVPGERVVIILDASRRDLGPALVEVTSAAGAKASLFQLEEIEARPVRQLPKVVKDELESSQASILLLGYVDGEQPMRLELLNEVARLGLRHAHMIGVTRKSLLAGFTVDPGRIVDTARAVRTRLRPDSKLRVRSAAGSDLEVKLTPAYRWAEHVGVIRPGRWENLPSGELMTAPQDTHGIFVADGSVGGTFGQNAGLLTRTPIKFEIDHNVCKSVSCTDRQLQHEVEAWFRQDPYANNVGTIVIGTNVGIIEPIGDAICDQNTPGLHLTFGTTFPEKTGAPNKTRLGLSVNCAHSDVDLDGAPLIRNGRYMIV